MSTGVPRPRARSVPAEIEAAAAGQQHVEDDDVERAEHGARAAGIERGLANHVESVLAQPVVDDLGELGVVFDEKDAHEGWRQTATYGFFGLAGAAFALASSAASFFSVAGLSCATAMTLPVIGVDVHFLDAASCRRP